MKKPENETFSIPMVWSKGGNLQMEIYICETNELNPHRNIKELGIVIIDKEKQSTDNFVQIDNNNEFGVEEIERLIKFLNKAKRHIKKFNENSKPTID
jgi:hypothetical protein